MRVAALNKSHGNPYYVLQLTCATASRQEIREGFVVETNCY